MDIVVNFFSQLLNVNYSCGIINTIFLIFFFKRLY